MIGQKLILRDMNKKREVEVFSETRKFWLCGSQSRPIKVNKKDMTYSLGRNYGHGKAYLPEEWERFSWISANKHKIVQSVRESFDYELLQLLERITVMNEEQIKSVLEFVNHKLQEGDRT